MHFPWNKNKPNKTCPKCGTEFNCVARENCWCDGVSMSKEVLSKIRKSYIDCLCEKCLESYSAPNA